MDGSTMIGLLKEVILKKGWYDVWTNYAGALCRIAGRCNIDVSYQCAKEQIQGMFGGLSAA